MAAARPRLLLHVTSLPCFSNETKVFIELFSYFLRVSSFLNVSLASLKVHELWFSAVYLSFLDPLGIFISKWPHSRHGGQDKHSFATPTANFQNLFCHLKFGNIIHYWESGMALIFCVKFGSRPI